MSHDILAPVLIDRNEDNVDATSMATSSPSDVTGLLRSWRAGEAEALDELLPLVYRELRNLAAHQLRRERRGHTLQPTALVHEAYVRLLAEAPPLARDRSHFLAIASRVMRRVLVDHARYLQAEKRGGKCETISIESAPQASGSLDLDVLAVHEAVEKLGQINARQAQLVELRYFGGLTGAEAAEVLGIGASTAERDWQIARVWLHRRLRSAPREG